MRTMAEAEWRPLAAAHAATVDAWSEGRRNRHGQRHPIDDFLWEYYSMRPGHLRRWHAGVGVALTGAVEHAQWPHYVQVEGAVYVDPTTLGERRRTFEWVRELLQQTLTRDPRFGCFAVHEWAMVYGLEQHEVRHEQAPLRLTPVEIAQVVERAAPLPCTHYDAFRFYTPGAAPLNVLQLTREDQVAFEQPGCLHANMDIYKWCYKLAPFISSTLTADAFALARDVRTLDCEGSPYDLTAWGVTALPIETPTGRSEFARRQRAFAERANALRVRLIAEIDDVLGWRA